VQRFFWSFFAMMKIKLGSRFVSGVSLAALLSAAPMMSGALAADSILEALDESKPILNARLRYEFVDQVGPVDDANAVTARFRAGLETGSYLGFSVLGEIEVVKGLNNEYNSTTNSRTNFPVVADPDSQEINRLQIKYTGIDGAALTVGRQRLVFDNARFIGDVGWRQNQQTFDAAVAEVTAIEDLKVTYGYIDSVQRIFGSESINGSFESDSHVVNAKYGGLDWVTLTAYAYLLDLEEAPVLSTATYGGSISGSVPVFEDIPLNLSAEYAIQSDRANNTANIDLSYYKLFAGTKLGGFSGGIAYEVLEGDGTNGFSTPLATVHAFQGWADGFLNTPANGIEDLFAEVGYVFTDVGPLPKIITKAVYHDFSSERTGTDLGDELDLLLKAVINPHLSATAKYATLDGASAGPADRDKFWFQIDFNL
jgi:hypothetical protein